MNILKNRIQNYQGDLWTRSYMKDTGKELKQDI